MKSPRIVFRPKSVPRQLLVGLSLVSVLAALAGCETVKSVPATTTAEGIPYHLPVGAVDLKLRFAAVGTDANPGVKPTVQSKTVFYPDYSETYLLSSADSGWFAYQHNFAVSNGLLSSVATTDESKVKETILAVVEAGIGIAKLGYFGGNPVAQGGTGEAPADPFLTDSAEPTPAEIAAILATVSGGEVAVRLDSSPHNSQLTDSFDVPGAVGSLFVQSTLKPIPTDKNASVPQASKSEKYHGIYTRTLMPYTATLELHLKLAGLRERRLRSYTRALERLRLDADRASDDRSVLVDRLTDLRVQLVQAQELFDATTENHASVVKQLYDPTSVESERQRLKPWLQELEARQTTYRQSVNELQKEIANQTRLIHAAKDRDAHDASLTLRLQQERARVEGMNNWTGEDTYLLHRSTSVAMLPNPKSRVTVPMKRSPAGRTVNSLTFTDGILTNYVTDQPSPIAETVKILPETIDALLDGLSGLIPFRVDVLNDETSLLEAETARLENQANLNVRQAAARKAIAEGTVIADPLVLDPIDGGGDDSSGDAATPDSLNSNPTEAGLRPLR